MCIYFLDTPDSKVWMGPPPVGKAEGAAQSFCCGQDEKPPKGKQRAAIRTARVRGCKKIGVTRLEGAPFGLVQRIEQRFQLGPLGPLFDRVLAFRYAKVLCLPDVDVRSAGSQNAKVEGRLGYWGRAKQGLELAPPRPAPNRLGNGLCEGAEKFRHLHGEHPTRCHGGKERAEKLVMVADPMKRGV